MTNYEFCAHWAAARGGHILDYGCGSGQIVGLLRARGADAVGCDVFYAGGTYDIPKELAPHILPMNPRIPFDDASFDVVLNNQVLEHVPDLDAVLADIARVLKPGGAVLSLFPSREVWREGHCGVPLAHRFAPRSRVRLAYLQAMHFFGFGYFTGNTSGRAWSHRTSEWLDAWTYYRPLNDIHAAFDRHFARTEHIEAGWLAARVPRLRYVPPPVRTFIARKWAGLVLVSQGVTM